MCSLGRRFLDIKCEFDSFLDKAHSIENGFNCKAIND